MNNTGRNFANISATCLKAAAGCRVPHPCRARILRAKGGGSGVHGAPMHFLRDSLSPRPIMRGRHVFPQRRHWTMRLAVPKF